MSYREDICKVAVLYREGGFSMDMDVQLTVPLLNLIDDSTSFMAVRHSNMLMAATPHNAILHNTVASILPWYEAFDSGTRRGFLGSAILEKGFRMSCKCGMNCNPESTQVKCGTKNAKLYSKMRLACKTPSPECPRNRINAISELQQNGLTAHHLTYGILSPRPRFLAGWSRFFWCREYGCGADNFKDKDWIDISQDAVDEGDPRKFAVFPGLPRFRLPR